MCHRHRKHHEYQQQQKTSAARGCERATTGCKQQLMESPRYEHQRLITSRRLSKHKAVTIANISLLLWHCRMVAECTRRRAAMRWPARRKFAPARRQRATKTHVAIGSFVNPLPYGTHSGDVLAAFGKDASSGISARHCESK